jgi:cell division septum initiation protein DivIVA
MDNTSNKKLNNEIEKLKKEYEKLKNENQELKKENDELKQKLKVYTNSDSHKRYYEKNTETVKQRAKTYMEKVKETNPEKIKEWSHNAYLKRKAKLKAQDEKQSDDE